jgi:hypothetical protein
MQRSGSATRGPAIGSGGDIWNPYAGMFLALPSARVMCSDW